MHRFALLLAIGILSPANAQAADEQRCDVTRKNVCSPDGCKQIEPTTYAVFSRSGRTYARCDRGGCDGYPAEFVPSGAFTTIEVRGRGMLARVSETGGFTEIVTLGLTSMISHGQCRQR